VRPALTWQDHRAESQARVLADEFGSPERLFGTSLPWAAAYAPAKLLWLAEHEPRSVERTRWVLQPKDFVGLRLTGSPLSDPWSSKGLCNVRSHRAVEELLVRVGWSTTVVPPLAQAWEARGAVTEEAASRFGLPQGIPVAVGWSDALAAMLAVGAFDEPTAFVLSGTSSIVGISTAEATVASPRLLEIPASCAPLGVAYGPTESAGASVEWLARLLRCEPRYASSETENLNAVRHGEHLRHIVTDENDGDALVANLLDQVEHASGLYDAQGRRGLVHEDHAVRPHRGARDRDRLTLTA